MALSESKIEELNIFAKEIRVNILETLNGLGFGHYSGSLSISEVLAVLYNEVMDINKDNFESHDRDHFILSKGHAGPALYSVLYLKGFFDKEFLSSLNQNGTSLPSHPDRNLTPGVDMTTGSLGQGISVAAGLAYGQSIKGKPYYTFTIVGDGELNEGQCWEAIQFAAHNQLNRFFVFVDDNKKQLDGNTKDVCQTFDLVEKFNAFGFESLKVNGANISEIYEAIGSLKKSKSQQPKCIVLDTIKGQGVKEIESMDKNHHLRLNEDMKKQFEKIAETMRSEVEAVK